MDDHKKNVEIKKKNGDFLTLSKWLKKKRSGCGNGLIHFSLNEMNCVIQQVEALEEANKEEL